MMPEQNTDAEPDGPITQADMDAMREREEALPDTEWTLDVRVGCVAVYEGEQINCLSLDASFFLFYRHGTWVKDAEGRGWIVDETDVAKATFIAHSRTDQRRLRIALIAANARIAEHEINAEIDIDTLKARIAELEAEIRDEYRPRIAQRDMFRERIAKLEEGLSRIREYLDMPIRRSLNTALINTIDGLLHKEEGISKEAFTQHLEETSKRVAKMQPWERNVITGTPPPLPGEGEEDEM